MPQSSRRTHVLTRYIVDSESITVKNYKNQIQRVVLEREMIDLAFCSRYAICNALALFMQ